MALTRTKKAELTQDLTEKWKRASSILFTHYIGLSVASISQLRQQLKTADAEMKVAKKTLLRRAAEALSNPFPEEKDLPGPIACIFNYADPLSGARVAFTFGKNHPQVRLVAPCAVLGLPVSAPFQETPASPRATTRANQ